MRYIETMLLKMENEKSSDFFGYKIENFEYHLWRVGWTINQWRMENGKWKMENEEWREENLLERINKKIVSNKENKKFRIRVVYSKKGIEDIEVFPIKKREFKTFKIVYSNIDYSYKYENRDKLNALKVPNFDEIIIVKNGLITDTTISNLAFFNGKEWHTPKTPLLKGTKREELLNKGILIPKDIKPQDIKHYKKFAMLNAIIGFYEVDINAILI